MAVRRKSRKSIYDALAREIGPEYVLTDPGELIAFAYDGQPRRARPEAVVIAEEEEHVLAAVRFAREHKVPLVARGAGSGMTGGSVPEKGGIVLDLERMNRIVRIDAEDRIAYCRPDVITGDLQRAAARQGLYYPPEPASSEFSSIGGNIAESAGGLGCVKYGLTKAFIAGLRFVTGTGALVATGVYTDRPSPFDPGAVLAGSEGTLGIVVEAALRLVRIPEKRVTVLALYRSLGAAAEAAGAVLATGILPAVLEFMDKRSIETVRDYAGIAVPDGTGAAVIVELDGDAGQVAAEHPIVREALASARPIEIRTAESDADRAGLWKLRKSLSPAIAKIAPMKFNEDVCVPLSRIPALCAFVERLGRERNQVVVIYGHAGDGNLHVIFMTDPANRAEVRRVEESVGDLFREVVRLGGTLSGEHGIGMAKRAYLPLALDPATISWEQRIRRAFDPVGILNPGKIFPPGA